MHIVPIAIGQVVERDLGAQSIHVGLRIRRNEIRMGAFNIAQLIVLRCVELDGDTVAQPCRAEPAAIGTKAVVAAYDIDGPESRERTARHDLEQGYLHYNLDLTLASGLGHSYG